MTVVNGSSNLVARSPADAGKELLARDVADPADGVLERRRGVPPRPLAHVIGAWQDAVQPLLRQQCWCWGWDVRRREGNLLLKRRFQRSRPPEATVGSSAYRLNGTGYRIGLWGFGVFYSRPALGAVFMGRHVEGPLRSPLVVPPRHVWTLDDLPRMSPVGPDADAADLYLLVELFRWIARYERWVQRTVGAEYREAAINRWGEEPVVSAAEMAPTWNAVGRGVVRA